MIRVPTHRPPTHPGEMLLEEFLTPMNLTQRELAAAIHGPYQRVKEIINGKRCDTPSTALRRARYGGGEATGCGFGGVLLRFYLSHGGEIGSRILVVPI